MVVPLLPETVLFSITKTFPFGLKGFCALRHELTHCFSVFLLVDEDDDLEQ